MANEVNGETIQEDVKPVNPKLAMREAIVQSVNAQRDEENGVEEEVVEETTEVEEVEEVAEELEESNTQDQEVEESQQEEEELVTIKVDGKEEQVPLSKIKDAGVRTFQKETAADKRLQEISEREKQLQAYTQLLPTSNNHKYKRTLHHRLIRESNSGLRLSSLELRKRRRVLSSK
jgi:hypothetical protein